VVVNKKYEQVELLQRRLGALTLFYGTALGLLMSKLNEKHHWEPKEYISLSFVLFFISIVPNLMQRISEKIATKRHDAEFAYLICSVFGIASVVSVAMINWFNVNYIVWLSVLAAWVFSFVFVILSVRAELDPK
jgi:disulfide bond formation protein DsbB